MDDTSLLSNKLKNVLFLLQLTLLFCKKYHVKLCPGKSKLQVFSTKAMAETVQYAKETNPIIIDGEPIEFVDSAEHVGLIRSTTGNLPTILARITAHRKALGAVLHTGMARGHRGNPAASLRVEQMYGVPVLLSGLGALYLSKSEENLVDQHHKGIIMNLQRLLPNTLIKDII